MVSLTIMRIDFEGMRNEVIEDSETFTEDDDRTDLNVSEEMIGCVFRQGDRMSENCGGNEIAD
jgi:hypothetical protein